MKQPPPGRSGSRSARGGGRRGRPPAEASVEERQVPFDPLAIYDYHDRVREKIQAGDFGFAQGVINDVMVSYESASFRGPVYGYDPVAFGTPPRVSAMLEQLIVDVARGEAIASPRTFSRARVGASSPICRVSRRPT